MKWREYQRLQKVADVQDGFISYVSQGSGRETLVFLHGIPTWGYLWSDFPALMGKNRKVLIPDLLGFGYSSKADHFDRSIAKQTETIIDWLDSIEVERATFVGHDIGGGVAQRLAALYPERVERLVLMNTICYDSWPIEAMLQLGHPQANRLVPAQAMQMALRLALRPAFEVKPRPEWIEGLLAPYSTEVGKLSLIRNASALNTNLTTELTPYLHRLAVPTLILWGAQDPFQPHRYGERLASDIPGSIFVKIEGASHFVMLDQAKAVARAMVNFLDQHPVARARTKSSKKSSATSHATFS